MGDGVLLQPRLYSTALGDDVYHFPTRYRIDFGSLFSKGDGLLQRTLETASAVFPAVKTSTKMTTTTMPTTASIWILKKKVRGESMPILLAVCVSTRVSVAKGEHIWSIGLSYSEEKFLKYRMKEFE